MKYCKKLTLLLIAALLLAAALMTGCTGLTPAQDAPADAKKEGIYVRLERDDAYAVYLNSDSFTKVCENADGTPLKSGEWIFAGEDIAKLSREENRSVLFTVGASGSDDTLLEEASFFYDIAKGTLYVTVGAEGVTCSTSGEPDAMADVPPVLKLAILDETDSGLDIDALRIVATGVTKLHTPENATVVITHYQRLLDYIVPDVVHVLYRGRIIHTGDKTLALKLEKEGYDWLINDYRE